MKPVVVSDVLAVGEFPTPDQIAILAKAGFKAILNNQPDGEVQRFASAADVEGEARRHGLGYAYAPLSSRTPPAAELAGYREALRALPAPIYAFCYSGSRSAAACAMLLAETTEVERLIADFGEGGFDLESLRPWLEEARARHAPTAEAPDAAAGIASAAGDLPAPGPTVGANGHAADVGSGNGAAARNGNTTPDAKPAAVEAAASDTAPAAMPRMVVVQPRAYGFGGFAM